MKVQHSRKKIKKLLFSYIFVVQRCKIKVYEDETKMKKTRKGGILGIKVNQRSNDILSSRIQRGNVVEAGQKKFPLPIFGSLVIPQPLLKGPRLVVG